VGVEKMTEKSKQQDMKVIVFELMNKEYAIKVDVVQSIERLISITRIPNTPSFVRGVINLRGIVTPIVDLRERFGIDLKEVDNQTRIIIVSLEEFDVGLIVDAANDVLDIPVELIESQPEVVGTVESEFISGVAKIDKRLLVMLDLERVLEPVKQVAMDEI
jgi:purine-binding chemotaxis protein CheW